MKEYRGTIVCSDELYHHGRLGQKWGEKNGPPYPLSKATVKAEYGTKKKGGLSGLIESKRQKKAQEKAAKVAQEEVAKRKAAEEAKAKHDADKARVLREGTASEVLQYANELTAQERNEALSRIQWQSNMTGYAQKDLDKSWNAINNTMKKVGNAKDWLKIGVEIYEQIDKAAKITSEAEKRSSEKSKSK